LRSIWVVAPRYPYLSVTKAHGIREILLGNVASPCFGEEAPGLGVASICPACYPRVWPPRLPTSRSISRGPSPALPAPGPADPTARISALLVTAIGTAADGRPVRRPSATWRQPEGAHCILLAPGLRCFAVCGLPSVRECMPMATTGRPNRYPTRQPNRQITSVGSQLRLGGGLLAVLTAMLGRGSAVACGNQDVVLNLVLSPFGFCCLPVTYLLQSNFSQLSSCQRHHGFSLNKVRRCASPGHTSQSSRCHLTLDTNTHGG
jgi:hypothetical protein